MHGEIFDPDISLTLQPGVFCIAGRDIAPGFNPVVSFTGAQDAAIDQDIAARLDAAGFGVLSTTTSPAASTSNPFRTVPVTRTFPSKRTLPLW